jgi:hypothetical protein
MLYVIPGYALVGRGSSPLKGISSIKRTLMGKSLVNSTSGSMSSRVAAIHHHRVDLSPPNHASATHFQRMHHGGKFIAAGDS